MLLSLNDNHYVNNNCNLEKVVFWLRSVAPKDIQEIGGD